MMLSCGDALVDFLPVTAADGRDAFVPAVGGSCLNVAVGLARLGAPAGFVGGISTDLFGRMIARIPIRMVLKREFPVGAFERLIIRLPGDTQDFVVVSLGHAS